MPTFQRTLICLLFHFTTLIVTRISLWSSNLVLKAAMFLQNDINTNGHTQWYFYRVTNTRKGAKVKFNMNNLSKSDSLYNDGMRVLTFSAKTKKEKNLGWHRVGTDISYSQNNFKKENLRFSRYYYTFTFSHTFEHDEDQVYFAHCFPYTYSDL